MAGELPCNVPRMKPPSGKEDLLRDACKPVMADYNNGCRTYPESYVSNMQWSLEFSKRVLDGERIPSSIRITGAALFGGSPLDLSQKPEFQTPPDTKRVAQAFTLVPGQSFRQTPYPSNAAIPSRSAQPDLARWLLAVGFAVLLVGGRGRPLLW